MANCFSNIAIKRCHLKHEVFLKTNAAGAPERRGLCNKQLRNQNLACAHSMAWHLWMEQLSTKPSFCKNPMVQLLLEKMDRNRTAIFLLDHRKGNLEKQKLENHSPDVESTLKAIDQEYNKVLYELEQRFEQVKKLFLAAH